jgi:hypothetical protein
MSEQRLLVWDSAILGLRWRSLSYLVRPGDLSEYPSLHDFSFVSGCGVGGKCWECNFPLFTPVTDHWGDGGKRKMVNYSAFGNCPRGLPLCDSGF